MKTIILTVLIMTLNARYLNSQDNDSLNNLCNFSGEYLW